MHRRWKHTVCQSDDKRHFGSSTADSSNCGPVTHAMVKRAVTVFPLRYHAPMGTTIKHDLVDSVHPHTCISVGCLKPADPMASRRLGNKVMSWKLLAGLGPSLLLYGLPICNPAAQTTAGALYWFCTCSKGTLIVAVRRCLSTESLSTPGVGAARWYVRAALSQRIMTACQVAEPLNASYRTTFCNP